MNVEPNDMSPSLVQPVVSDSRYHSADSIDAQPDTAGHASKKHNLPWRPPYLYRRILLTFVGIFILMLLAVEILLTVSNQNSGIANGHSNQHYLWTYSPTALLTLLAMVWDRAEYQSKLVTPWLRLSREAASSRRTLLIDYNSDYQLATIYKSAVNKDYAVTLTSTVSVLIKVLIVISTGLITLSRTLVSLPSYPIIIQDKFVDNLTRLRQTPVFPRDLMIAVQHQNMSYPDGISSMFAFQSTNTTLLANTITKTNVEGFSGALNCIPAELEINVHLGHANSPILNISLTSSQFNVDWQIDPPYRSYSGPNRYTMAHWWGAKYNGTGDPHQGDHVFVVLAELFSPADNMTEWILIRSAQMLCMPAYRILDVEVTRNGTQTIQVMPLPGTKERRLETVTPSDIMEALIGLYGIHGLETWQHGGANTPTLFNLSETVVEGDALTSDILSTFGSVANVSELYDFAVLNKTVSEYYSLMTAIIAKQYLTAPAPIRATTSITQYAQRLVIRSWSAQWMAGILATCILMTGATLMVVPRHGLLPCNPSTISSSASILMQSSEFLKLLCYSGATDEKALSQFLRPHRFRTVTSQAGDFQPSFAITGTTNEKLPQVLPKPRSLGILHPVVRFAICVAFIGLIISLELVLLKSQREEGLGDGNNDTYIHYAWTTIPSIILGSFAMLLSAVDFSVICIAPPLMLQRPTSLNNFLNLDFLDMTTPHRILKEIKMASWFCFASTSALLIASLFTIFSASLFQAETLPSQASAVLRANQSLNITADFEHNFATITGIVSPTTLIFESNLTFPRFTYNDLVFPELLVESIQADTNFNASSATLQVIAPAIRSQLSCRTHDASEIRLENPDGKSPVLVIQGEECFNFGANYNFIGINSTAPEFGVGGRSAERINGCSNFLYVWGGFNPARTPPQHLSSMGCNVTFQAVDVEVNYANLNFDLDPGNPPRPLESTARDMKTHTIKTRLTSRSVISLQDNTLNDFFTALTESPWAIAKEDLSNPQATQTVQEAIRFHTGIILAQALNTNKRIPANATNATLATQSADVTDGQPRYIAQLIDPNGRSRVIQDAVSTRILEILLGLALLAFVTNWVLMPDSHGLPARSPTTIAAAAALVAGGDLPTVLPQNAAWCSRRELAAVIGPGFWFQLGWGPIGGDGDTRFGIFAICEKDR